MFLSGCYEHSFIKMYILHYLLIFLDTEQLIYIVFKGNFKIAENIDVDK